jgi:inward rectifier potassium channel
LLDRRVDYVGLPRDGWRDGYHLLLTIPLPAFLGVMGLAYVILNGVFALLYMLDPEAVAAARPGNFADHFFFSVETLGTLGYGVMSPRTLYGNAVMTLESFVGLFNLAIATGLMFARISRPTARIMFSDVAVVTLFEGVPALMFRAANRRRNLVVEAEVSVSMVQDVATAEGVAMRRFFDLPVVRARSPLFRLTWQVIHRIDEASPLHGFTAQNLVDGRAEILVVMKGLDETFASTIHARKSYGPEDIVWGRPFVDIFFEDEVRGRRIDFRRFHQTAEPRA